MILYIAGDIPTPETKELDSGSEQLTSEEIRILKDQIRKNAATIDHFIRRLDLFVNQEGYPGHVNFVEKLHKRLSVLMEENDTFRKTLWKHFQREAVAGRSS